ncbi:uncharacterized protein LOC115620638 [Scaptodrosophila lebanonensis]|uniref:Uncharacterized protein LOC115620638 n=1 Tax=Drosophila lebanonensis TaxID=7225 RepID=A0A6J2T3L8_DROLE|nr:uncharacterized protein LOC115620638 [Scaptodrosophila lebanonensis]
MLGVLPPYLLLLCIGAASAQIAYTRHLSDLRIRELQDLAVRLNHSINTEKYACENYFDYVCSRNRPLFSIMGHIPETSSLIELLTELQNDPQQFEAKQKLLDFFISCNTLKSVEDCYRETFEYFKPLFGYIITRNLVDGSTHELQDFLDVLTAFLKKTQQNVIFERHPIRANLATYHQKFLTPRTYFQVGDLNREYGALRIYRESYQHNLRNLELHRRLNSTYELGVQRTMLDWSLYLYQSRSKPMSYYYSTFTVHLYMMLFNSTERQRDFQHFRESVECLKLPQFVNVLDEARTLAVIYLKSFRNAWQDYSDWIKSSKAHGEIYDHENEILKQYHLSNKRFFFTFYAQNFCEFGRELAENVFYLGLKQNPDFFNIYSCGYQTELTTNCV